MKVCWPSRCPVSTTLRAVAILCWVGGGVCGSPPALPYSSRCTPRGLGDQFFEEADHISKGPSSSPLCSRRDDFRMWPSPCLISSWQVGWDCFFVASALKRSFVSILGTEFSVRSKADGRQKAAGFGILLLSRGPGWFCVCWELPKAALFLCIPRF